MFFGGGMMGGHPMGGGVRFHRQQQQRGQRQQQQQQREAGPPPNPLMQLLQMAPILLLFLMSMFGGSGTQAPPPFSLSPTSSHSVKMVTRGTSRGMLQGIEYYVGNDFIQRHGRERRQVEYNVQQNYHDSLRSECLQQKDLRRRMLNKAKFSKSHAKSQIREQAENLDMSTCEE